jgi:hypothetical protein
LSIADARIVLGILLPRKSQVHVARMVNKQGRVASNVWEGVLITAARGGVKIVEVCIPKKYHANMVKERVGVLNA